MRRRAFMLVAGAALSIWLPAARAQAGRVPVIGYLVLANPEPIFGYFKEGLRQLGHVDGKGIRIEFRHAEGKPERLAGLAAELVRLKVDVLVAAQTPAVSAAKQATSRIPIVMAGSGDPVATGLIASFARPGGNITGSAGTTTQTGGKTLELVRETLPAAKRVAVLANATDPFTKPFLEQLQRSAPALGFELAPMPIRQSAELGPAFADMVKRRIDAVVVQPSLQRRLAAELALRHRLPAVSPQAQFAAEGGLIGYSASQAEMQQNAAEYVDRILKGAQPADLPVRQPSKFELTVNLKTAKALGIPVPRSVLLRADQVIE